MHGLSGLATLISGVLYKSPSMPKHTKGLWTLVLQSCLWLHRSLQIAAVAETPGMTDTSNTQQPLKDCTSEPLYYKMFLSDSSDGASAPARAKPTESPLNSRKTCNHSSRTLCIFQSVKRLSDVHFHSFYCTRVCLSFSLPTSIFLSALNALNVQDIFWLFIQFIPFRHPRIPTWHHQPAFRTQRAYTGGHHVFEKKTHRILFRQTTTNIFSHPSNIL